MSGKKFFRILNLFFVLCCLSVLLVHDTKIRKIENQTERITLSRDAFVQIVVYLDVGSLEPIIFKGSGTLISKSEQYNHVLSVNHLCNPTLPGWLKKDVRSVSLVVTDFSGEKYDAEVTFNAPMDDLCLIKFEGETDAVAATIAEHPPALNDKIFVFAAPTGFFAPHVVPLFEGHYAGDIVQFGEISSVYTFPATGGSSGGGVLNSDGEIVGVVHSVLSDFHHISLASTHSSVQDLLLEYSLLSGVTLTAP